MPAQKNKYERRAHSDCGFTVIEALIAVAVFGILTSLAYSSYQYAVRKTKRAEGRAALMELMQQQERFYLQHSRYIRFSSESVEANAKKFKWFSGTSPKTSAYEIRAEACDNDVSGHCVLLLAIPGTVKVDSAYIDVECGTLSMSSTGMKSPVGRGCW